MKACEVCGHFDLEGLVENGALWCCNECNAKLCEYCAETTEYPLIPIQNDAGYIAQVCPVCTLETAKRMFGMVSFGERGIEQYKYAYYLLAQAIKSLKGE
jgi:hypothetical protein